VRNDPGTIAQVLATLDPRARGPIALSERELGDLLAFLESLTSLSLETLPLVIPEEVPSGLPVDRLRFP
jgi:cytochrome c peroxidase